MTKTPNQKRLWKQLQAVRFAHRGRAELTETVKKLEQWQKNRLAQTYADLSAQPRFKRAVAFFMNELYAPDNLVQRDADLRRVYPAMLRLLPDSVLKTVADAAEVQALSMSLDTETSEYLNEQGVDVDSLDGGRYGQAYRSCDQADRRRHQVDLLLSVGNDLERLVRMPGLYTTLKLTALPAKLAGLGALQRFLESGFGSFRSLKGAEPFLTAIEQRETAILDALVDGQRQPLDAWRRTV